MINPNESLNRSQKLKIWESLFVVDQTPIEKLGSHLGVELYVKRDDKNHKLIQGNKLRKLKYNFRKAIDDGVKIIYTFGGAYSNHLSALAKASQSLDIKSVGFIRGNELEGQKDKWSATLQNCQNLGMELRFISREDYRNKTHAKVVQQEINQNESHLIIPEGGSNASAVLGVKEMMQEVTNQRDSFDWIFCACGTGGSLAGIIDGAFECKLNSQIVGVPVLGADTEITENIVKFSKHHQKVSWKLVSNKVFGRYAKLSPELIDFGQRFYQNHKILLDRVYNVKAFYLAHEMIKAQVIQSGQKVLLIHTGGLQGGVIK